MTTTYVPNSIDINWARNVTRMIKNGGKLAYPSTQLIYTVWHDSNVLELTNPEILADADSAEVHERTRVTFAEIGWTVR